MEILDLGRCDYGAVTERMLAQVEAIAAGSGREQLWMCEFAPVVTVGRGEDPARYAAAGLPVFEVSRGGKATYHGPGQVVAYPLLRLAEGSRDLHGYLHRLEEALIRAVGDFGLLGSRDPRNTGCWVNGRKVASIGIAVRRWVAYHGVALNVNTDLSYFHRIDPCGLEPALITSMQREAGRAFDVAAVRNRLADRLVEALRG